MATHRGEERQWDELVKLGRENASLWPKIENWCRHLKITLESSGLLARFHQLPVGQLTIECEHAPPDGMHAMQLREVASDFIDKNCRGCKFHEIRYFDNIGQTILDEWDKVRSDLSFRNKLPEPEPVPQHLDDIVSGDLADVFSRAEISEQSILRLVALLDDPRHHLDAAKNLVQSAKIGPELFSAFAIDAICRHFPDAAHGDECMRTVREVCRSKQDFPDSPLMAAASCLHNSQHADTACSIIGDYVASRNWIPPTEALKEIIGLQHHGHEIGGSRPPHGTYPGSNHALQEVGKRDLLAVVTLLRLLLSHDSKFSRINASHIILSLLDSVPGVGLAILDDLISSLELDDDPYGDSADGTACSTLAAILVRWPTETETALALGYKRLSREAKATLYRVYRFVAQGSRWAAEDAADNRGAYKAIIPRIVPVLLQSVTGLAYPLGVKEAAVEALTEIAEEEPFCLVPHLDTILGAVPILIEEQQLYRKAPALNQVHAIEKSGDDSVYRRLISELTGILGRLCEVVPHEMFSRLRSMIRSLSSTLEDQQRYKAELIGLWGRFAEVHDLAPGIVPEVYRDLMNFDSVLLRGAAVQAVGNLLERHPEIVPGNMVQMLIAYLRDPYNYVHKSAARALWGVQELEVEDAFIVAHRLSILDSLYEEEPFFRRDIQRTLESVCSDHPGLLQKYVGPLLLRHARVKYLEEDALEALRRRLPALPAPYTSRFVTEVIEFLGRRERDRFNGERFTPRRRLYESLFDLPKSAIHTNLAVIKKVALAKIETDPWDALKMVHLLSHFEFCSDAAELGNQMLSKIPQTERHRGARNVVESTAAIVLLELYVGSGQFESARLLLARLDELEQRQRVKRQREMANDVMETIQVAERITKRARSV